MKLTEVLRVVNIQIGMEGSSKDDVLAKMVNLASRNNEMKEDLVLAAIKKREDKRSSGFGKEVALPHAFSKDCDSIAIGLAVLKSPVEWAAADKKPIKIAILITSNPNQSNRYISMITRITKIIIQDHIRDLILHAKNVQEIHNILRKEEKRIEDV